MKNIVEDNMKGRIEKLTEHKFLVLKDALDPCKVTVRYRSIVGKHLKTHSVSWTSPVFSDLHKILKGKTGAVLKVYIDEQCQWVKVFLDSYNHKSIPKKKNKKKSKKKTRKVYLKCMGNFGRH